VVDFALVSLILIPLFMAILQLGMALYARNTLAACAQEGARYAADHDIVAQGTNVVVETAKTRTTTCVRDSLTGSLASDISADTPAITDKLGETAAVVEVRISSPFPLLGLFGLGPQVLHVKADAMQEVS
jgi:Flp pilus assembly protein TadG